MWRRCLICLSLLLPIVGLAACTGSNSPHTGAVVYPHPGIDGLPPVPTPTPTGRAARPVGYFSYQLPIIPITVTVNMDGSISLNVSMAIATPLGEISFGGDVAETTANRRPLPVEPVGVTQLIICKAASSRQDCQGYAIRTGRKVSISMNGRFQQTIENGRVTIDAYPGSTVTVTDAGALVTPNPRAAARIDVEDFYFNATSPYTEVNLKQSQGGRVADLSYDHVTGTLALVNGAMVADVQLYRSENGPFGESGLPTMNLPGENDCARTRPDSWRNAFTAAELKADIIVSCIFTAEKDFGYLVIGHDSTTKPVTYYIYSYTWVR
jgi:hypothetical protein